MKPIGRFITVEGTEGVGKSTNIEFARACLVDAGVDVIVTREPGGTELAELIRQLLLSPHEEPLTDMAELLLVFAARSQHLSQVIKPAIARGQWVLCDRFTDATYAYQGGGRQLDIEAIAWLEQRVQAGFHPDLTLLLDIDVSVGLERVKQSGEVDRIEAEEIAFFERVRRVYLDKAKSEANRYRVIDASGALSEVQSQIKILLDAFIRDAL